MQTRAMTPPRRRGPPPAVGRPGPAAVQGAVQEEFFKPKPEAAARLAPPPSPISSAVSRATSPVRKKKPPTLPGRGQQAAGPAGPVRGRVSTESWTTVASSYAEAGIGGQDLGLEEVKGFLRLEGYEVDDSYALQCFEQFDADSSGGISLDEFGVLMEHLAPDKLKPAISGGFRMPEFEETELKQTGDAEPWHQAKVDKVRRRARGFYDKHKQHNNGAQLLRGFAVCGILTVLLVTPPTHTHTHTHTHTCSVRVGATVRDPEPSFGCALELALIASRCPSLPHGALCSQVIGLFFWWWYNYEADPAASSCGQPSLIECHDYNTHTMSS